MKTFADLGPHEITTEKDIKQNSPLNDDDSPTQDSGVLLDSDLNDSMISSAVLDYEEPITQCEVLPDLLATALNKNTLSKSDIENNNENPEGSNVVAYPDLTTSTCDADMISSIHSTFDTENTEIVYRRKIKKQTKSAPKKRVSFHEDILNSTRTDNIHIEHGFITYRGRNQKPNARYSWC